MRSLKLLVAACLLCSAAVVMAQRSVDLDPLKTDEDFIRAGYIKVPATLWMSIKKNDGTERRIYGYELIDPKTMTNKLGKPWSWEIFFARVDLQKKAIESDMENSTWTKQDGWKQKENTAKDDP